MTADSLEGEVADLVVSGCIVAHEKANEDSKKVLPFSLSWAADDVQEDNDRDVRDFDTPREGGGTSGRDADAVLKTEDIFTQRQASLSAEPPGVNCMTTNFEPWRTKAMPIPPFPSSDFGVECFRSRLT